MIDTLVFDFDGVFIDTETPHYQTWQEAFRSHGVVLDRELWARFIGGGVCNFDVYEHLEELAGAPIDRDAVRERTRRRYLDRVGVSPLLPGVVEYLEGARRLGLKTGVASSSNRAWVEGHLQERGLMGHIDSVVTSDDVSMVKPDPELYLSAVSRLGTEPRRAVAIEDSANGVAAAKAAGLFCLVVPNSMTREMTLGNADLRLESLSDMSLDAVLALASGTGTGACH